MNTRTRGFALFMAAVILVTMLSGCATKPYVMVIDGMKIRQGTYAYYYGYSAKTYSSSGDTAITYYTLTNISQHVAIIKLFEKYGLKLTKEEKESVEAARTAKINSLGGQAQYASFLKLLGLTDKLYREILTITPMYSQLRNYLYGEGGSNYIPMEEVRQIYADLYAHEVHIYFSTASIETTEDNDEIYARAEEAYARAKNGENFTDLILEYGDDLYMAMYPEDGYYIAEGDSGDSAIDEALFALEVGEISKIVTTSNGYYIYKRLPIGNDYLDTVFKDDSMYNSYIDTAFYYYLMEVMTAYDIEYLTDFYEVDYTTAQYAF